MPSIGTEKYLYAEVLGGAVEVQRGLLTRLELRLQLQLEAELYDERDSDRRLHALGLAWLEGDLFAHKQLIGGARPRSPFPIQGREPAAAELILAVDLDQQQLDGLLRLAGDEPLPVELRLRGECEVWSNPLYDHDGHQLFRVGDQGAARAMQQIGLRERRPLARSDQRLRIEAEALAALRQARLGG